MRFAKLMCMVLGAAPALAASDAGGLPPGWFAAGTGLRHYAVERVERGPCGRQAVSLRSTVDAPQGNASVMQVFRAEKYRGKRLRFSAKVATEDASGWAGLWMRIDGPEKEVLAFDNMQARPLRGTTPCATQTVVLDVAPNAEVIALGLVLEGPGTAQLSAPSIEVVDAAVPVTALAQGAAHPSVDDAIGRVGSYWFTDRYLTRLGPLGKPTETAELRLETPGRWSDRARDFTVAVDHDTVVVSALVSGETLLALSGEFRVRREGDANVIEGTWGTLQRSYPVQIRFSKTAVDMKWGFYERHLKAMPAPQLPPHCVFYAQVASVSRFSDSLELCGVVFDADAPRAQTVLSFLLTGFRRFGSGIPLDVPATPPVLPPGQDTEMNR